MNNDRFSGKVALVTGGTSGIGKTTAIEFARAGAKVVLTGRREKEGAQVVAEIKKHAQAVVGDSSEIEFHLVNLLAPHCSISSHLSSPV